MKKKGIIKLRWIVLCVGVWFKWPRHVKTEKHRKGVEGGGGDGKVGGDMVGAKGGLN